MNFQDKIAQRIQERNAEFSSVKNHDSEGENEPAVPQSAFYGIENQRNYGSCLDLRLADGNFKALPYSYILEINFNPSEGIEFLTATKKISIKGRNLRPLYNYLAVFRVRFIQANIGPDLSDEESLFVKEILISEL